MITTHRNTDLPAQPEVTSCDIGSYHMAANVVNPAFQSQLIHNRVNKWVSCLALQTATITYNRRDKIWKILLAGSLYFDRYIAEFVS